MSDEIRIENDNGRRWRIEGPGWTMQPVGEITVREAEALCRAAFAGLSDFEPAPEDTPAGPPAEIALYRCECGRLSHSGPEVPRLTCEACRTLMFPRPRMALADLGRRIP